MPKMEVFYDYECPYCMRGVEYLLKHMDDYPEVEVSWRPVEGHPRPEEHPPHTDLAIQGYHFAVENGVDPITYNNRLFDAMHKDRIDVEDPAVLADYVKDLVDADAYEKALRDGSYKAIHDETMDLAYETHDVWYIPVFIMGEDRLDAKGGIGVTEDAVVELLKKAKS